MLYRQILSIDPQQAEVMNCLALIGYEVGQYRDAITLFRRVIQIKPDFYAAHVNLGSALQKAGYLDEAIDTYQHAVSLRPQFAEGYCNLAGAFRAAGRLNEALAAAQRAVALRPDLVEAQNNLGHTLQKMGAYGEAKSAYERALALRPDEAQTRYNLGLLHLLLGEFEKGWELHEARFAVNKWRFDKDISQPVWDGSDLGGRRILLQTEQGFGDTIQFIRLVTEVRARNGRVVVRVRPPLKRLLCGQLGIEQVIDENEPLPQFDVHLPLLSLPRVLKIRPETIPARIPYLTPDPAPVDSWRRRLGDAGQLRVGIAWFGNPHHRHDRERSLPSAALAPLFDVPGVRFVSLQKAADATDSIGNRQSAIGNMTAWTPELHDYADTAALIANLDLVISCDTSVAHLAGALGKRTWVMLPFSPDWRWLLDRSDSPWYPTMRLFRQPSPGDWSSVVLRVRAALANIEL